MGTPQYLLPMPSTSWYGLANTATAEHQKDQFTHDILNG
jgi:hypothetical protein